MESNGFLEARKWHELFGSIDYYRPRVVEVMSTFITLLDVNKRDSFRSVMLTCFHLDSFIARWISWSTTSSDESPSSAMR